MLKGRKFPSHWKQTLNIHYVKFTHKILQHIMDLRILFEVSTMSVIYKKIWKLDSNFLLIWWCNIKMWKTIIYGFWSNHIFVYQQLSQYLSQQVFTKNSPLYLKLCFSYQLGTKVDSYKNLTYLELPHKLSSSLKCSVRIALLFVTLFKKIFFSIFFNFLRHKGKSIAVNFPWYKIM